MPQTMDSNEMLTNVAQDPYERLHALFNPRSIAIVGASPEAHRIRGLSQRALVSNGYRGKIFPVNPSHREIQGLPAYPNLASLPETADLAIISLPGPLVMQSLKECHAAGIRNAVVFSASASVAAEGEVSLHDAIGDFAKKTGMRIVGPNTEGFYNVSSAVAANFNPLVAAENGAAHRDLAGRKGIGIVSHSGGLAFGLYARARVMHAPVRFVIGTGNESDVEALEVAEYLVREGQSTAIMMFLEGFKHPEEFERLAAMAADAAVPLIIMKTGGSDASKRAAVSHTGHLTGADAAYDAMFHRYGVFRVSDPDEMISIAAAFCQPILPKGNNVCILTATGGTGAWVADLCAANGLVVPETDSEMAAQISGMIPDSGAAVNPIDVTAAITDDGGRALAKVLDLIRHADTFDSVILIFNLAFPGRIDGLRPVIEEPLAQLGKPVLFVNQSIADPGNLRTLAEMKIFNFSFRGCAQALDALGRYQQFQTRWKKRSFSNATRSETVAAPHSFRQQRELLRRYDIPLAPEALAGSEAEALAAAQRIGFPVVVKIESPDLPHKSDIGGVVLGVQNAEQLQAAYAKVRAKAQQAAPHARIDGVLIQKMARPGIEMVLGATRDPDFGPLLMLGFGGIYVEILRDTVLEPIPIGPNEADAMISRLKAKMLLDGVRGAAPRDVDALRGLIINVSRLMADAADDLAELEFNPVIVHAAGEGITVVDTLFVTSDR